MLISTRELVVVISLAIIICGLLLYDNFQLKQELNQIKNKMKEGFEDGKEE